MLYHQTVDQIITREIIDFTAGYCRRDNIATEFGKPLVGFADAMSPEIQNLTSVVSPDHLLPQDVMPEASIIISYFVPFTPELAAANNSAEPGIAAAQWARAYEELNALFTELNRRLVDLLPTLNSDPSGSSHSFRGAVVESATHFDTTKLISNWSHRHIAFAAGLGTFGMNNMLITPKGCCGRYNSVITNIPLSVIHAGSPMKEELCSYKRDGSCHVCIDICPTGALAVSGKSGEGAGRISSGSELNYPGSFDRQLCFALCSANAELYPQGFYTNSPDTEATGNQVCGKCVTGAACAFRGESTRR